MEHVLVDGEIQLQVWKPEEKANESGLRRNVPRQRRNDPDHPKRIFQPPGLNFLSTCKQACAEGYPIFFSKNMFYLPWGPVGNSYKCFDQIGQEYQSMIRKLGVTYGLQDLDPAAFEIIKKDIEQHDPYAFPFTFLYAPIERERRAWVSSITRQLELIWDAKTRYLWPVGPTMKNVKIGHWEEVFDFDSFEGLSDWHVPESRPEEVKAVWDLKSSAASQVQAEVEELVGRDGPEWGFDALHSMATDKYVSRGWSI